jgi:hypothetical protein
MIEELREWIVVTFMVPQTADPWLFAINTLLLGPGVVSFALIFILYIFVFIYLIFILIMRITNSIYSLAKIHIINKLR